MKQLRRPPVIVALVMIVGAVIIGFGLEGNNKVSIRALKPAEQDLGYRDGCVPIPLPEPPDIVTKERKLAETSTVGNDHHFVSRYRVTLRGNKKREWRIVTHEAPIFAAPSAFERPRTVYAYAIPPETLIVSQRGHSILLGTVAIDFHDPVEITEITSTTQDKSTLPVEK